MPPVPPRTADETRSGCEHRQVGASIPDATPTKINRDSVHRKVSLPDSAFFRLRFGSSTAGDSAKDYFDRLAIGGLRKEGETLATISFHAYFGCEFSPVLLDPSEFPFDDTFSPDWIAEIVAYCVVRAVGPLRQAVQAGFNDLAHMLQDEDLPRITWHIAIDTGSSFRRT